MITIKKGLDIPISGAPQQIIEDGNAVTSVATLGEEYVGMRPTMHVQVDDRVKKGQVLFEDKKNPGVKFTAPASGVVKAINRGARRVLQSVVIDIDGNEQETFPQHTAAELSQLSRENVQQTLVDSGMWVALRTRPYSRSPKLDSEAKAIFVNAMDTNPLAADPALVIQQNPQAFIDGLKVVSRLTEGKTYLVTAPDANIDSGDAQVARETFKGPHPAGNVGTHIHFLEGADMNYSVWHLGYQDVIAIGKLFTTGEIFTDRVVAIGGPGAKNPRLVRTRLGADIEQLTKGEVEGGNRRIVSGSVLNGHKAAGPHAFLGRFHNQVSILGEGNEKHAFGWIRPGKDMHSITRAYLGHLFPKKAFDMNASTNGSERAMVPIGTYERVMPLDVVPTLLLRSIVSGNIEMAQELGCLELDEEDLALCTYVCPGKYEYGTALRECLTTIEKEG